MKPLPLIVTLEPGAASLTARPVSVGAAPIGVAFAVHSCDTSPGEDPSVAIGVPRPLTMS